MVSGHDRIQVIAGLARPAGRRSSPGLSSSAGGNRGLLAGRRGGAVQDVEDVGEQRGVFPLPAGAEITVTFRAAVVPVRRITTIR